MTAAHDIFAERAVINAAIGGAWDDLRDVLRTSHFAGEAHRKVWAAVAAVGLSGAPMDARAVDAHLQTSGAPEAAREALQLATLELPSPKHAEAQARRVRDLAAMRNVVQVMGELSADAARGVDDVSAWLDAAERTLVQATDGRADTSALVHLHDWIERSVEAMTLRAKAGGGIEGYASGLTDLDTALSGFAPGKLIVIGGRPGSGKTALAKELVLGIAASTGKASAVFSLEVPGEELADRALVGQASVEYAAWRQAKLDARAWQALPVAAAALGKLPVWIDDTPGVTVEYVARAARRLRAQHGDLGCLVIDHMMLMGASDRRAPREQQVGHISRQLKTLAKEAHVPVIALAQLNRKCEDRQDKRPMLSDIRESGNVEQDADAVIFTYRDEYYDPKSEARGVMEAIISKQRAGTTGTIPLAWDGARMKIRNLVQVPR